MLIQKKMTAIEKILYQMVAEDICQDFRTGSLLDVGCGDGKLLSYIQRLVPDAVLTGIDFSKKNIKQANKFLDQSAKSGDVEGNLKFMVGDIQALPIENDKFDRAVSTCALHHFPYIARSFAEIYRVLKPGGTALIYDFRKEASYEDMYWLMYEWSANITSIFRPWILKKWMREYYDYVPQNRLIDAAQSSRFKNYRLEKFFLIQRPVFFKLLLEK